MKLIIDMPQEIEKYVENYIPVGSGYCFPDEIVKMLQNGIPLADDTSEEAENNTNEALDEDYQRRKQEGFESNTAYRHGYYDGQKDAYKEREVTERHWGRV